jgi:AraC-like DNA-binding protein
MRQPPCLYERAAENGELDALWDIRDNCTLFAGPLYYNASHQHGAPVFLAGLYGKFQLRLHGGDWLLCRTAIIPAGVLHELDVGGEPIAVLYIEPVIGGTDVFKPLINSSRTLNGALVGNGGEINCMRDLYENRYKPDWTTDALQNLLDYSKRRAQAEAIDPRLTRIVDYLFEHGDDLTSVAALSAQVGLSPSRFHTCLVSKSACRFGVTEGGTACAKRYARLSEGTTLRPRRMLPALPIPRTSAMNTARFLAHRRR